MSFSSAVRVAAATAASTDAPGAAVTFARNAGYRPVMAVTASKTETCTMAIVRTAMGVAGFLEAISAAFALASLTTSAWANGTVDSIRTVNSRMAVFITLLLSLSIRALTIDVQTEGDATRVEQLGVPTDGMVAGALHVAEQPLQTQIAEETGAGGHLHRDLDGANRRAAGDGATHEHLVGRFHGHVSGRSGIDHLPQRHSGRGELGLHQADQLLDAGIVSPARGLA